MTSFAFTGFASMPQVLNADETGFVGVSGALVTTDVAVRAGSNTDLVILGNVTSLSSSGVSFAGSSHRTTIGQAGSVVSDSSSFFLIGDTFIANSGLVQSTTSDGIFGYSDDFTVVNDGTIRGRSSGIEMYNYLSGSMTNADFDITNTARFPETSQASQSSAVARGTAQP